MANYISKIEEQKAVSSFNEWADNYKQAFVETQHDSSQLHLLLPDDCLIFAGPPRKHMLANCKLYPIGFINQLSYSETRQVQPLKGIGSRRHVFASTNAPIQGNIGRMLFHGRNLLNALYACASIPSAIKSTGTKGNSNYQAYEESAYWANLEDDIFRVPFGLGIVYGSPASLADQGQSVFAEYLEVCVLTGRQSAVQAGQAMLMEQVSFMADRVVAWEYTSSKLTVDEGEVIDTPALTANHKLRG